MTDDKTLLAGHYMIAVQGLAMIRDFIQDPDALRPRADEVATIVSSLDEFPHSIKIPVTRYDVADGYTKWAPRYDGPNPAIEVETPIVADLLSELEPPGVALDAACGTGRHAVALVEQGWQVVGVDATPAMLDLARAKVPTANFRDGQLQALPIEDSSVDLVVCSLALTHVEDLGPVFAEFARVLRPGGHVMTTDMHPVVTSTGGMANFPVADSGTGPLEVHYVPNLVHQVSDYVQAMIGAGLTIRRCVESLVGEANIDRFPSYALYPEATREAFLGLPYLLIWQATK